MKQTQHILSTINSMYSVPIYLKYIRRSDILECLKIYMYLIHTLNIPLAISFLFYTNFKDFKNNCVLYEDLLI
jgi:hypothetical protein